MYETKIIVPSRKGKGLTGLGVGTEKASVLDRVMTGGIVLLVIVLVYTVVEPFVFSSRLDARRAELDSAFGRIAKALTEFESGRGAYTDSSLVPLQGRFLDSVPQDPWGNDFIVDTLLRRIVSPGPDGVLETPIAGFREPEADGQSDDQVFFYRSPGTLWVVGEGDGDVETTMWRLLPDGTSSSVFAIADSESLFDVASSPRGEELAVVALPLGGRNRQIAITDSDGLQTRFVTIQGENDHPAWSPDGLSLLYRGHRSPDGSGMRYDLYQYTIATDREERLTSGRIQYGHPAFHPFDSSRFVSVAVFPDRAEKVALMNIGGSDPPQAVRRGGGPESSPVWCTSGDAVYFIVGSGIDAHVVRVRLAGRVETQLTSGAEVVSFDVAPWGDRLALIVREGSTWSAVIAENEPEGRSAVVMTSSRPLNRIRWTP